MNCDLLRVGNPEEVEYVIDKIERIGLSEVIMDL